MKRFSLIRKPGVVAAVAAALLLGTSSMSAHCDTMDGPVITAAQKALDAGQVDLVLIWVQKKDEAQIREAFGRTLAVRKLGPEAKKLADMYFFETLVRIHRAGEGVAYTGIKPAGTEVEPGIAMADQAIAAGSPDELQKHIAKAIQEKVSLSFREVNERKNFRKDDVEAGRKYVGAYVKFIHYIEGIHQAVAGGASHGHAGE